MSSTFSVKQHGVPVEIFIGEVKSGIAGGKSAGARREAPKRLGMRIVKAIRADIKSWAKQFTGRLSESWVVEVAPGRGIRTLTVGSDSVYAQVQDTNRANHNNIRPKFYVAKAVEKVKPAILKIYGEAHERIVDEAIARARRR